jgi:DDE superfamily endonuclease
MTERRACSPGPLEAYPARFDDLFLNLAQRRGFREYLTGLLAPRDRNKTLTCLAGVESVVGAGLASVQRLQYFLSESGWDSDQANDRQLELLRADPACAPHEARVIVIDDSGDRKDGTSTAHVGRQWLDRLGKTDNGVVVTVTTVWTDGRVSLYPRPPLRPRPHRPRLQHQTADRRSPGGPGRAACFACRAVVADSADSVSDNWCLALHEAQLAHVVHHKPHRGTRRPAAHPRRRRTRPYLGGPRPPRRLDTSRTALPRRTSRDLVGRRGAPWRLAATGPVPPGRGHHRRGHPAGQGHLVPGG